MSTSRNSASTSTTTIGSGAITTSTSIGGARPVTGAATGARASGSSSDAPERRAAALSRPSQDQKWKGNDMRALSISGLALLAMTAGASLAYAASPAGSP